jgi:ribosome-interacting GTPase 1
MMPVDNIQVQLVDTPSLDRDFVEPALFDLVRRADLILLVVDLQADPLTQLESCQSILAAHTIYPIEMQNHISIQGRVWFIPSIILVNKCDDSTLDEDFAILCDLFEGECPLVSVSAIHGRNFELIKRRIVDRLDIIRVYARPPGKEPDLERPFVLKKGSTIADLAPKIHRDFSEKLKSARVWGSAVFDGQLVHKDYLLQDGDIVELRI